MPDMLPGKKAPRPVDSTELINEAAAALGAPDPEHEQVDEDDLELNSVESDDGGGSSPAGQPPAQRAAAAANGDQPATPVNQPAPKAAAQPAAAPVAGSPATVVDDPWAETEDITYIDEDDGKTYVVRVPKSYAASVKNGYQRRSYTDRKLSSLGRNRSWIEPLIENGSFDRLAPHLQQVFGDTQLQTGLAELLNRRAAGLPLKFADQVAAEAAAAGAAAGGSAPIAAAPAQFFDEAAERQRLTTLGYDEYTINASIEAIKGPAQVWGQQFTQLQTQLKNLTDAGAKSAQDQQFQQRRAAEIRQVGNAARMTLLTWYPNELKDDAGPIWNQIEKYANDSGIIAQMGFTPGAFTTAYQRMRETGLVTIPDQTRAPSAAIETVAQIEATARQQAAAAAQQTATAVASPAPRASANNGEPRKVDTVDVPRFRKDARTGRMIPLTPVEQAAHIAKKAPQRQPA